MNTPVAEVAVVYPQPLPDGAFRGQSLQDYEASYAVAVATALGAAAIGNQLYYAGHVVTVAVRYTDFAGRGSVCLDCARSSLRGWMKEWPLRHRVPVKPATVAEHIRVMAEMDNYETARVQERARLLALNGPLRTRLETARTGDGIQPCVIASDSLENVVYVTVPRQGFICTEEQAAALIAALNALPTSGLRHV